VPIGTEGDTMQQTGLSTAFSAPFALGSFSVAGGKRFGGLVIGERVIALDALKDIARANGLVLAGTDSVFELLQDWHANFAVVQAILEQVKRDKEEVFAPLSALKVHAPVDLPRQIFCTGANYYRHVVQLLVDQGAGANPGTENMTPEELYQYAHKVMNERARTGSPYVFSKVPSAVTGPYDPIVLPAIAEKPDWELELAVVIGKAARHVSREQALDYVAGYTIANDITSRDLIWCKDPKAMGTDWTSSKNAPTFLPLGPYVVPAAFVADPQNLRIHLSLNGETKQDDRTSDMLFDIARQIEYISSRAQLWPGDIICTGSPAGNGTHYNRFLQDGDVVDGAIEGLGAQRNRCVAERTNA
jgi:2-keto-4-pentenoate hydratase/2-oxohepta-3-ene-1,7-dioic acid hydratase in catechol pathway